MIRELRIANLGVIADTAVTFHPGLTVLTGETGAGKTLITTAVSQLLGAKPDNALIRHGADEAVIDCALDVPSASEVQGRLQELGARHDEDELLVTRTIGARSRAIVGGRAVAAAVLHEILASGITLHGQHGQTRLTKSSEQRALLDAASPAIANALPMVRTAWQNLREARQQLLLATEQRESADRDVAVWRQFMESVDEVGPEPGEDERLDARIATLSQIDTVMQGARTALTMLSDAEDAEAADVVTLLHQLRRHLEHHSEAPEFAAWAERVVELLEGVQGVVHDIHRFVDGLDQDPDALDALLARRAKIGALLRRHGMTLDALLAEYEDVSRRLALAEDPETAITALQQLVAHCAAEFETACAHVHALRVDAATVVAGGVEQELHELGLAHATFSIAVDRTAEPTQWGDDSVEFRFSANPGQPQQPLAAVGSGGELSRVMLALETATANGHGRTFIFDEVDAGVGGKAAVELGRRLAGLARQHQVIVVTHLAQVAAFADQHVVIEKLVQDGQTLTAARALAAADRPRELARMLSGFEDSVSANAHAEELLASAASARRGQP